MLRRLYLFSLALLVLYSFGHIFNFINADFSYPVTHSSDVLIWYVSLYFYPAYTFIAGLLCLKSTFIKRIFFSLLLAIGMLLVNPILHKLSLLLT